MLKDFESPNINPTIVQNVTEKKAPLKAKVTRFNASIIMDTDENLSYSNIKKALGQAALKGARSIHQ